MTCGPGHGHSSAGMALHVMLLSHCCCLVWWALNTHRSNAQGCKTNKIIHFQPRKMTLLCFGDFTDKKSHMF